jgi:ECF sigma factor
MASSHSVTHWIGQLRAGDPVAAQHLWEGYTTEEIAARLRRAPRTVERKLDLIRRRWTV